MESLPDGRVRIALKRAWSDGTTALELSRLELVERLVSLVPPPRANQVHYHGVLASRSRLRARVRPKAPKAKKRPATVGKRLSRRPQGRSRWRACSDLLWRVFGVVGFGCPKCGHAMQLQFISDLELTRVKAAAMSGSEERESSTISLLTAFRAKGRQFDTVVVLDANDGFWPASQAIQKGRIEEERRLFYVAATRAQANLLFFSSDFVQGYAHGISPFIEEMGLPDSSKLQPKLPDDVVRELLALYPRR